MCIRDRLRVVQTGVYPDAEVTVDPKQIEFNADEIVPVAVSYTHLDVYKRQEPYRIN